METGQHTNAKSEQSDGFPSPRLLKTVSDAHAAWRQCRSTSNSFFAVGTGFRVMAIGDWWMEHNWVDHTCEGDVHRTQRTDRFVAKGFRCWSCGGKMADHIQFLMRVYFPEAR